MQGSRYYIRYDHYPCDGDGPRAPSSGACRLLQPCIFGTLIDAMRTTLVVMRAGDCARQSVIVSPLFVFVCFWQRARPLSPLTQKVIKKHPPPLTVWVQSGCAFRIRLESSLKQNRSNCVDNYGIFKLVHNTNMRVYTFLGENFNAWKRN